jgi:hypothetical protein
MPISGEMDTSRRGWLTLVALFGALLVVGCALVVRVGGAASSTPATRDGFHVVEVTPEMRREGLRFGPEVTQADREWILAAIAAARPEARRLIDEVDGLLEIHTQSGPIAVDGGGRVIGMTTSRQGGFEILLDVASLAGNGSYDRDVVVLHELGHVVDHALVPATLAERLDAGIPGGVCESSTQLTGNCAEPAERFADTFARWALRNAVSAAAPGYGVQAPLPDEWGAPLIVLAQDLDR